jgi:hypothetical protein
MSNQATPPSFLACIPHAIESQWDNVWAPRLAGFPSILSMQQGSRVFGWPKQCTFSIPVLFVRASRLGGCGIARQSKATFRSW